MFVFSVLIKRQDYLITFVFFHLTFIIIHIAISFQSLNASSCFILFISCIFATLLKCYLPLFCILLNCFQEFHTTSYCNFVLLHQQLFLIPMPLPTSKPIIYYNLHCTKNNLLAFIFYIFGKIPFSYVAYICDCQSFYYVIHFLVLRYNKDTRQDIHPHTPPPLA